MSQSFRDNIAWQKSMALVVAIYRETRLFPRDEVFGLTAQVRRAAISIPSNTAEGKGRHSTRDYIHFLYQARGSLNEVETQLEIAANLKYLEQGTFGALAEQAGEVGRLLNGLIKSTQKQLEEDPTADG